MVRVGVKVSVGIMVRFGLVRVRIMLGLVNIGLWLGFG